MILLWGGGFCLNDPAHAQQQPDHQDSLQNLIAVADQMAPRSTLTYVRDLPGVHKVAGLRDNSSIRFVCKGAEDFRGDFRILQKECLAQAQNLYQGQCKVGRYDLSQSCEATGSDDRLYVCRIPVSECSAGIESKSAEGGFKCMDGYEITQIQGQEFPTLEAKSSKLTLISFDSICTSRHGSLVSKRGRKVPSQTSPNAAIAN